ncbi:MAG: hypothetical protein JOS17DRAFT_329301 [Linnemannia elongata]|nr:MAG: hypothetical protein JOS17DRAFT_329301 [Linnemannia elongata]
MPTFFCFLCFVFCVHPHIADPSVTQLNSLTFLDLLTLTNQPTYPFPTLLLTLSHPLLPLRLHHHTPPAPPRTCLDSFITHILVNLLYHSLLCIGRIDSLGIFPFSKHLTTDHFCDHSSLFSPVSTREKKTISLTSLRFFFTSFFSFIFFCLI